MKEAGEVSSQLAKKPGGGRPESGINRASRELGINKDEAYRAVKIASLTPEAKKVAIECGLDDNKSALLKAKDKSGDAAKEIANLRAERAGRDDAKKRKDAGTHTIPPPAPGIGPLAERLIWNIHAGLCHLQDSVPEATKLKPKMSEAELKAVCAYFYAVEKIAVAAVDEMLKEIKKRKQT